jgi:16S rRNA (cytosine967-C5)-methyltransferase
VPPGDATPKVRRLEFLAALQSPPPVWVGVRVQDDKAVWAQLRDAGLKPWIHRRLKSAAKLPPDTDLSHLEAVRSGRLVVQDLASQAVGVAGDPDPGERWWVVRGEHDGGLHALSLATKMGGKGAVICTFETERRRHEAAVRLRPYPARNITTKLWDGRHTIGKAASFDGVLVEAPSSGIGTWRRHPDARWTVGAEQIAELAARAAQMLDAASSRVRAGGTLLYTVSTVTRTETTGVVEAFLGSHSQFRLQPFPHPLEDATTGGTVLIWPQTFDCDARFIARMIRT